MKAYKGLVCPKSPTGGRRKYETGNMGAKLTGFHKKKLNWEREAKISYCSAFPYRYFNSDRLKFTAPFTGVTLDTKFTGWGLGLTCKF